MPSIPGKPLPFFIILIILRASSNCLISEFTSWTGRAEPFAIR